MSRWILVRHGESAANAGGWLSGWEDVPLTERGEEQARALSLPVMERVLCSDLQRARRTAELACEQLVTPSARLRERHLGAWAGRSRDELKQDEASNARLLSWDDGPPRGEAHQDLARRVVAYLAELDDSVDTLVIAHGAVIRTLVGLIDEVPEEEVGHGNIANGEVIEREVRPGTWRYWAERLGVRLDIEAGLPESLSPLIERIAREGGDVEQGVWRVVADDEELRIGMRSWPLPMAYDLAARLADL